MTRTLLAATAMIALLAGCREGADGNSQKNEAGVSANAAEATAASLLGAAISGEDAKRIMDERHEGMEEIGDAMKLVSAELKRGSPNLDKVRSGAATIARFAPKVQGWYPPGTGPDVGKTRAKAEIWQKPEDFAAKIPPFEKAAAAFDAAAKGSDLSAIKAAHADLGKSCKACHDPYRAPED